MCSQDPGLTSAAGWPDSDFAAGFGEHGPARAGRLGILAGPPLSSSWTHRISRRCECPLDGIGWPLERPVKLTCSVTAFLLNNHSIKGMFFIEHPRYRYWCHSSNRQSKEEQLFKCSLKTKQNKTPTSRGRLTSSAGAQLPVGSQESQGKMMFPRHLQVLTSPGTSNALGRLH